MCMIPLTSFGEWKMQKNRGEDAGRKGREYEDDHVKVCCGLSLRDLSFIKAS
jgi:hypothetical protein